MYAPSRTSSVMRCEAALRSVTARRPALGHVAAFVLTPQHRARIVDALHNKAVLLFVPSFDQVLITLRSSTAAVDVVVLPGRDNHGTSAERIIRHVKAARPGAAIVAWCGAHQSAELGALASAGVHEFILSGLNDTGVTLRAVVEAARRASAAEQVMSQLAGIIPPTLHPVAEAIVANPARITSIRDMASELGIHRKTLFNWTRRAGSLAPAELLGWCRLALVAYHLEATGCTVETISLDLGYPSPTSLRNTLKRYTGMTASDLRRRGAFAVVAAALRTKLNS